MPKLMSKNELRKLISYFLLALAVIISYKLISDVNSFNTVLSRFFSVISPFFFGFALAYLLNMPRGSVEKLVRYITKKLAPDGPVKKDRSRGLSILLTYVLFLVILYIALSFIIPLIFRETVNLVNALPGYIDGLMKYIDESGVRQYLPQSMQPESIMGNFSADKILGAVGIGNIWSSLMGILGISTYLVRTLLALISSIYFMIEGPALLRFVSRALSVFIPRKQFLIIREHVNKANSYFNKFLYCLLIDAIILGALATVLLLAIGSEYAPLLGPVLGLFNLVPYFGAIVGVILAVVVLAFTGGVAKAGIALILLIALQQVDGSFIQPRLMGGSMRISPLLVIFAITIGGAYFGMLGIILAIPVVATIKDIIGEIIDFKEKNRSKQSEENADI